MTTFHAFKLFQQGHFLKPAILPEDEKVISKTFHFYSNIILNHAL